MNKPIIAVIIAVTIVELLAIASTISTLNDIISTLEETIPIDETSPFYPAFKSVKVMQKLPYLLLILPVIFALVSYKTLKRRGLL